jgi:hypothetical protein
MDYPQQRAARFNFLKLLYEATKDNPMTLATAEEIGLEMGLDPEQTDLITSERPHPSSARPLPASPAGGGRTDSE